MEWIKFNVYTNTKDAPCIGDILLECGIAGYETKDHVPLSKRDEKKMYTDIPADMGFDDGSSILTFYTQAPNSTNTELFSTGSSLRDETLDDFFAPEPTELIKEILDIINERKDFLHIKTPEIVFEIQDDSLWKDKWKENFKPFHVADDIIIKPSWEDDIPNAKENDIIIEIDPGSAFGTGTHETTKLCLLTLRKYITDKTNILDAGCGSGILAIAALLCGANKAFCLDIDKAAVDGTLENAANNNISPEKLTAIQANILDDWENVYKKCSPPYDIFVANILADVIIPMTKYASNFMKDDGIFISSGILLEKSDDVENAFNENNFEIIEKNVMGDWVSYVCKKA